MPFDQGLARLNRQECMTLLAGVSLARAGVSVDALPVILPITIALMDDSVVFRTVPGTKLASATAGAVLAVEADHYDPVLGEGWGVLVRGIASEIRDEDSIARARKLLASSWIGADAAEHYVRISCDLVTGRRLRHLASSETWPDAG